MSKVLSLFTGAGGLDIGLEEAGFEVAGSVEIDHDARKTLNLNSPHWPQSEKGDIHLYDPNQLLKSFSIKRGELALLSGGPPCQPFSKASYWAQGDSKRLLDPRSRTLQAYLDIVEAALPEVILLENVKGIGFRGKDEGLRLLEQGINKINSTYSTSYNVQFIHINAVDYGVPQSRERIFLIAHREGKGFIMPEPTHGVGKCPFSTAWDAIGEYNELYSNDLALRGKWKDLLPSIPEGKNYLWHTARGGGKPLFGWRTRYWSFLLKLAKCQPSWTIQAYPGPAIGPFHWNNRMLSVAELAALQTFPKNYQFHGSYISARAQIGNAVPCAIGEMLGLEIIRQFYGKDVRHFLNFIPSHQVVIPAPENVRPIHKKYKDLIGDYDDHPGPGLGPGVKRSAF